MRLVINGHFRAQQVTGVQRYAREIISRFDQQNVTYDWIQPPAGLNSDALRQLWIQGVMPYKIPDDAVLWSPTNIGPISCENQVLTLHDIPDQIHPEWYDKKYVAWRRFILPKLLRRVRSIITTSNYAQQTIVDHYPQTHGKVNVIYNGVNTDHFYPRGSKEQAEIKSKLDLRKPFVLNVGSLATRKNTHGLIEAWLALPAAIRHKMDLVIAGSSAQNLAYNRDIKKDESVRFTGYIEGDELAALYSAARLFVFPSLFEGFGLPVLEAMACGTAVVTSNTTALKEIAGPALTVDPTSTRAIREAMLELIQSSAGRSEIVEKGREWAGRFTWKKTAHETMAILKKLTT